jgi:hypothetical protein
MRFRSIFLPVIFLVGCSSAPNSGGNGGGGGNTSTNGNYECCLNGTHYSCPSDQTAKTCAGLGSFDLNGCMGACAPSDFACHDACLAKQNASGTTPDPSACTQSAGSCSGGTGGNPGGICSTLNAGADCTADYQCGSGKHCTSGSCYPNDADNPCTADYQCGSDNHCSADCCYTSDQGNPCTADYQCSSGNCTNDTCQ